MAHNVPKSAIRWESLIKTLVPGINQAPAAAAAGFIRSLSYYLLLSSTRIVLEVHSYTGRDGGGGGAARRLGGHHQPETT